MAISLLQTASGNSTGATVTAALAATASGSTIIACVGGLRSAFATGVACGTAALTAAVQAADSGASATGEIWWADNVPSGRTAVTVTFAGTGSGTGLVVYEVSGLAAGGLDKTSTGSDNTATSPLSWTSGATGTLAQANEIIIGASGQAGLPTITGPPAPWTNTQAPASGSGSGLMAGVNIVTATTSLSYAGSTTHSGTIHIATVIATFRASSAIPRTQVPRGPAAMTRSSYY